MPNARNRVWDYFRLLILVRIKEKEKQRNRQTDKVILSSKEAMVYQPFQETHVIVRTYRPQAKPRLLIRTSFRIQSKAKDTVSSMAFQGLLSTTILGTRKIDTLGYPMVKTASLYVISFWHNTGVWRTDRRTDGRICRSIYSACKNVKTRFYKRNNQC